MYYLKGIGIQNKLYFYHRFTFIHVILHDLIKSPDIEPSNTTADWPTERFDNRFLLIYKTLIFKAEIDFSFAMKTPSYVGRNLPILDCKSPYLHSRKHCMYVYIKRIVSISIGSRRAYGLPGW